MDIALPPDFREFLSLLHSHGVEYLLIGGYAVAYHGYPRATDDIDVWIAVNPENADRLVAALDEFGFELQPGQRDAFLDPKSLTRMGRPPLRIEVLTAISGVSFPVCYERREVADIDGVPVSLISL